MLGKIEGRKRGQQRVRMIGWHHQLNGHEFEQSPGVANGQGSLVCCSPWGHRVGHDTATDKCNVLVYYTYKVYMYIKFLKRERVREM